MKKILSLLFILCCTLVLAGCNNNQTIQESRTVVLEIDTDVVPTFTSNFGSGSYNETTKKYTHTIDYIKDLYISLSYEDLKTVTVYIPTKEMENDIITKQIEFGETLDAEVDVTVEGVKSLEGLIIDENLTYSNLKIGKRNTFKLTLPSREQDYSLKFTLPNYRPFEVTINKDSLISGSTEINVPAITTEQVYIGFQGTDYNYKVYSFSTNEMVASGNNYGESSKTQYVLLNNDDSYYVKVSTNEGDILYRVEQSEDKIIKVKNNMNNNYNYLRLYKDNTEYYYTRYVYDKKYNLITDGSGFYNGIENKGLVIQKEGSYLYLDDIASKATASTEYSYEYIYHIDENDFVPVTFDITRINRYTNEEIISNSEYFSGTHDANLVDNQFNITIYEIEEGVLTVELKDENGDFIKEKQISISSYFQGQVYSDKVDYKGKVIPYQFPIFYDEIIAKTCDEYDCHYTYPAQTIDTSISYTMIKIVDRNGNVQSLSSYSQSYILDANQELIMGMEIDGSLYFELEVGKQYTLHYENRQYTFTTTENDISSGNIVIYEEGASVIKVKVDPGIIVRRNELTLIADEQGIVKVPITESESYISVYLSNSYVSEVYCGIYPDGRDIYEMRLYALAKGSFYSSNYEGSNHIYYTCELVEDDENETVYTALNYMTNGNHRYYEVSVDKFIYDNKYEAYVYDVANDFAHVITMEEALYYNLYLYDGIKDDTNYLWFVNNDINFYYNGEEYTLEDYASYKNLQISYDYSGGTTKLKITPIVD